MTIEMQYIGACSLLGRLSGRVKDEQDRYCIKRALDDCAAAFPGRFEVVKAFGGGWLLEPILTPNCSSAQKLRSLPDVAALAKEFCRILSETLSAEQVAQVLMRNAEEANPSICHSHDFCDANMVMQAAFDSFGVDPMSSGEDGKAMSDEIAVLWADAWDMAKGAGFNASDVARKTAARPS